MSLYIDMKYEQCHFNQEKISENPMFPPGTCKVEIASLSSCFHHSKETTTQFYLLILFSPNLVSGRVV